MCIKNFKRTFVTFVATLVMMFALVACSIGATSMAATEARKNLKNAVDQIALEHTMDLTAVKKTFKLNGVLVQFGATVTWESSNEDHLKIEADGANYIAKVTRPARTEENVDLTLTAVITVEYKDENGATKSVSDEKIYNLTVLKKEFIQPTSVIKSEVESGEEAAVKGVVIAKSSESLLIQDDEGAIMLYKTSLSFEEVHKQVKLGDVVQAEGIYSPYNGLHEIGNLTNLEIVGSQKVPAVVELTEVNEEELEKLQCQIVTIELFHVSEDVAASVSANFKDANGNPVVVRGDAKWSSVETLKLNPGTKVRVTGFVNWYKGAQLTNVDGYTFVEVLEETAHVHTPCEECGKCTDKNCDGAETEKCPGHEVVDPSQPTWQVVTGVEANKAYKLGFYQPQKEVNLYLTGDMKGYYGATTENPEEAADVYAVAVEGGYKLKVVKANGDVTYIALVVSGTHNNFTFVTEAEASVFAYDAEQKTMVTLREDNVKFFMGTYGSNVTFGMSDYDKYIATSYVSHFYALTVSTPEQPEVPTHEHDLCEECGKCLKEDCPDEKCPGHEVEKTYLTIAEVKKATSGTVVALKGVVIAKGTESLLIQDATGAIMLYKSGVAFADVHAAVEVGQEVAAEGKYSPYNGLHEVASLTSLTVTGTSTAPAPTELATIDAATIESLQCQIVTIELTYVSGTVAAGANAKFADAAGTEVTVRGDSKWDNVLAVELIAGAKVKVTAFVNWYNGAQLTNVSNYTFVEVLEQGVVTHEHTACAICQKCTASDCTGTEEEKCAGHEAAGETTTYSYQFTSSVFSANGTKALNNVNWTLAGDGGYWGFDSNNGRGQQFGSGSKPYKSMTFTSDAFTNVSKLVINTCGASSIAGTAKVYVGETLVGTITLTKTATEYTFTLDAPVTGAIKLEYTQTSSKAIYIKAITVEYAG